jgi:hypothetical protein
MPGPRTAVVTGLLILAASLCAAPPAQAAVPSNDDFDAATVVTSVPYSDTTSTVEATRAPDDPPVGQGGAGGSVWYAFTSSADAWIEVNTAGSDFDTVLGVVTGERGAMNLIASDDDSQYGLQSAIVVHALAGTTYHFIIDGYNGGGTVVLNVQSTTPGLTSVTVTVAARGTIDRNGWVTVHGTVLCDQVGSGYMYLSAVQSRRFTWTSSTDLAFPCGTTATPWSATFASAGVTVEPGSLSVTYDATAGDHRGSGVATSSGESTVALVNAG